MNWIIHFECVKSIIHKMVEITTQNKFSYIINIYFNIFKQIG